MTQKVNKKFEGFPQVFKGHGCVTIVYRNHVEIFSKKTSYYAEAGTTFDPYNEIDMARGNGMKRVHGKKTVKVIDFTKGVHA